MGKVKELYTIAQETQTSPLSMTTFRVGTWETEYKKAYIDAKTRKHAERIALQSLRGERADVDWDTFDHDGGEIVDIEEC